MPKKVNKKAVEDQLQKSFKDIHLVSEVKMRDWIREYVQEIKTVETFFVDQFNERVSKFMDMQAKYLLMKSNMENDNESEFGFKQ